MKLNREININKKFIILLILINLIALGLYYSYALFEVNLIQNNIIVINTGTVNLTTTVQNETDNTFTVSGNSSKTVTVNLTSTNSSELAYKMYYENLTGELTVTSTESFTNNIVEGLMTTSKTITLTFTNNTDSSVSITLGGIGGLAQYSIPLEDNNKHELIIGTIKPAISDLVKLNLTTTDNTPDNYVVEDGIYYISGCKEDGDTSVCNEKNTIDFNYVWYSGKLWRITAIYPDGRMKMITEDPITSIYWGSNTTYEGSWMYQWLNEDFKDTLYNHENIIDENATWNATMTTSTTKPAETTMVIAPIGSLNTYEYVKSYAKLGSYNTTSAYGNGYLNIGYNWWLMTPYNSSNVRFVNYNGNLSVNSPTSLANGVRPSINLKSGIVLSSGEGTKSNPYKISGDKEEIVVNTTFLNMRMSGEYVTFKDELYRIVGIENNTTKIVKVDYVRDGTNAIVTKNFASSITFGKSTNTASDTYWDYYLNNTWLRDKFEIDSADEHPEDTYDTMLSQGTYYLGEYGSGVSYKNTICKTSNTIDTVIACEKIDDTNKIYTGYVGVLRVGEMFSSQLGSGYATSSGTWLITPYSSSSVRSVGSDGSSGGNSPGSNTRAVRPSLNLKSTILILGGDGTLEHPFEIE